ncbi:MAG TPA: WhiB family transcriptional regulator [Streptosporangiaceae bacterium]|nr:WhiB family transcriptional regulator [Streptosporangiaceae bacterium]
MNAAWQDRARCAEADPDLWFSPDGRRDIAAAAKRVCEACPVRAQCLDHAVTLMPLPLDGIWAGLTHAQLRAVAARRGRPRPCYACGQTFQPASRTAPGAYCSDGCRAEGRRERQLASQHWLARIRRAG